MTTALPHDPYITAVTDALTTAGLEPSSCWTSGADTNPYGDGTEMMLNAILIWDGDHQAVNTDALPDGITLIWEHPAEHWQWGRRGPHGTLLNTPQCLPNLGRWSTPEAVTGTVRALLADTPPPEDHAPYWHPANPVKTAVEAWATQHDDTPDQATTAGTGTDGTPAGLTAPAQRAATAEQRLATARAAHRVLLARLTAFRDVLDDTDSGPWDRTVGAALTELGTALNEGTPATGTGNEPTATAGPAITTVGTGLATVTNAHTGWNCPRGASLIAAIEGPGRGTLPDHHGCIYVCPDHQAQAEARITAAGHQPATAPAPPSHRRDPWPCGHITTHGNNGPHLATTLTTPALNEGTPATGTGNEPTPSEVACGDLNPNGGQRCGRRRDHLGFHRHDLPGGEQRVSWVGNVPGIADEAQQAGADEDDGQDPYADSPDAGNTAACNCHGAWHAMQQHCVNWPCPDCDSICRPEPGTTPDPR